MCGEIVKGQNSRRPAVDLFKVYMKELDGVEITHAPFLNIV